MANYRHVSMNFWTDSKVVDDFSPEDRYIYLWCLTNPHTNLCGCYEVSLKQVSDETGYNKESIIKLLKRLDNEHNVIRYNVDTKELLLLNWDKYNWSTSEKLNKPLLAEIQNVKSDGFREFLASRYNQRSNVPEPYDPREGRPKKVVRHKFGNYGRVRLSDDEYSRLVDDLGKDEADRCISYVDEFAQQNNNKNKWSDWNLVVRKCHRDGWGMRQVPVSRQAGASGAAMDELQQLHGLFEQEGV